MTDDFDNEKDRIDDDADDDVMIMGIMVISLNYFQYDGDDESNVHHSRSWFN